MKTDGATLPPSTTSLENYLVENSLQRGEDYVRLFKALRTREPVLARRIADAGAAVFPGHRKLQRLKSATAPKSNKVFGVGLSKTGTTSLTFALIALGYSAAHWRKMPEKEILSWEHIDMFDALTDVSISFMMEPLYFAYPRARFIYTVREMHGWERSIEHHFAWLGGFHGLRGRAAEQGEPVRPVETQPLWGPIHRALYTRHAGWREAYAAHEDRVRGFFCGEREDALLTIDLTRGSSRERWLRLCGFLGEEIPLCPIPHKNTRLVSPAGDSLYPLEVNSLIEAGRAVPDSAIPAIGSGEP
jgi:hypothetical protein